MKVLNLLLSIIKAVLKITLTGLILVLIVLLVYPAWWAGQPMDMPQFGGLAYYRFLGKQRQAYL